MVKCYYCGRYKHESKMNKVVVGRGRYSTSKTKDGIDYVSSCGCYENKLKRDSIDYINDEGKIYTKRLIQTQADSTESVS